MELPPPSPVQADAFDRLMALRQQENQITMPTDMANALSSPGETHQSADSLVGERKNAESELSDSVLHSERVGSAGDDGDDDGGGDSVISETNSDDEPRPTTDYGSAEYWDERYATYSPFDWLIEYPHFAAAGLDKFLNTDDNILMIGCGSAAFSSQMYDAGYVNIKNIDLSNVVIEKMRSANIDRPHMTWSTMDCTALTYDDETFDVAIDKSTMDCIFCCENSNRMCSDMVHEAWRVLKPGGLYICISLHSAAKVEPYLAVNADGAEFAWSDMENFSIPNPRWSPNSEKSTSHEIFLCIKPAHSPADVVQNRGVRSDPPAFADEDSDA